MDYIWEQWVSDEEKERVASLEMLDEVESGGCWQDTTVFPGVRGGQ
jgi:hypothetical protein